MNSTFAPAITRGIKKHELYESAQMEDYVGQMFHVGPMDGRYEDIVTWRGFGLPQEHQPLQPVSYTGIQPDFAVRKIARSWTLGFVIPIEDKQDDLYGILHKLVPLAGGEIGRAYHALRQILAARFWGLYGFQSGTSVPFSPDGVCFFSTANYLYKGSTDTFSTRSSTDMDFGTAACWMADVAMRTQKRPDGNLYLQNSLAKLHIHPTLRLLAQQVLKFTEREPRTADFSPNVIARENIDIVSNPYFEYAGSTGGGITLPVTGYNSFFFQGKTHYAEWGERSDLQVFTRFDNTVFADVVTTMRRMGFSLTSKRGLWGSKGQ